MPTETTQDILDKVAEMAALEGPCPNQPMCRMKATNYGLSDAKFTAWQQGCVCNGTGQVPMFPELRGLCGCCKGEGRCYPTRDSRDKYPCLGCGGEYYGYYRKDGLGWLPLLRAGQSLEEQQRRYNEVVGVAVQLLMAVNRQLRLHWLITGVYEISAKDESVYGYGDGNLLIALLAAVGQVAKEQDRAS